MEILITRENKIWVRSTSGNIYIVDLKGLKCDCLGYFFKKRCKHVEFVKNVIGEKNHDSHKK